VQLPRAGEQYHRELLKDEMETITQLLRQRALEKRVSSATAQRRWCPINSRATDSYYKPFTMSYSCVKKQFACPGMGFCSTLTVLPCLFDLAAETG
jgi:hypothetical protein